MATESMNSLERAIVVILVLLPFWLIGNLIILLFFTRDMIYHVFVTNGIAMMLLIGLLGGLLAILFVVTVWQYYTFKKKFSATTEQYPQFLRDAIKDVWKSKNNRVLLLISSVLDFFWGLLVSLAVVIRDFDGEDHPDKLVNVTRIISQRSIDSTIFLFLASSLFILSLLTFLSTTEVIRARIIKYWSKDNVLRTCGESVIVLSLLGSLVIATSMISSVQLFTLTMLQFLPLFFIILSLGGIFITISASVGIFFGWVPFLLFLFSGIFKHALFFGLIYAFLLLTLLIYYGNVVHLSNVKKSRLSSIREVSSLKAIEKDLENREIDILLKLATEQGWATWKNRPWMKIIMKEVQRRLVKEHPLDYNEFLFFHNCILYMPKISFNGVINLEKLSKMLNLGINQLKSAIKRHWGSDALFLSPKLVVHKHQLMLAESFSFDELKSLNVDEINLQALQTTIESLTYYGFTNKAEELRKSVTTKLKSRISKDLQEVKAEMDDHKSMEKYFDDLMVLERASESLTTPFQSRARKKLQKASPKLKTSRNQIIEIGESLLSEGNIYKAFKWFSQHEYWIWALDVSGLLLKKEISNFIEFEDQERLIQVLKEIYDVFLKANLVEHVILQDMALVVLYLRLQDELKGKSVDKERIAFCYEDIYHLSPHLFPAVKLLERTWRLFSEAGNHSKAAEILQILADKSTGLQRQKYYDLYEAEMQKDNRYYECIKDQKRHQMDAEKRKICPRCKKSTCIKCIHVDKESEKRTMVVECVHCGTVLEVKNKKRTKVEHIYCISLDFDDLIQYVLTFFSQKP